MKIHCHQDTKYITSYYFTKSENECVRIEYDKRDDYGRDPSGANFSDIEIHNNNAYITDNLTEISIEDGPECIIDLLSFLK